MKPLLALLLTLTACKVVHQPKAWHGIPAGQSVACETMTYTSNRCVSEGRVYFCVFGDDTIECAPYTGDMR